MSSWNTESQPRNWQETRIGRSLSYIKERLPNVPVIRPIYRAAKVVWSNTDNPDYSGGVRAYWMSGGREKDNNRR